MAANRNLAAVAGAWSARHRRRAVFGWLAFVVAAYVLGGLVGQHNLTDAQMGNGASARATVTYQRAFPSHTGEEVLVQGPPGAAAGPGLGAAVADVVGRLSAMPSVSSVQAPFAGPGATVVPQLLSADGRSALVTFLVAGDSNRAQKEVAAIADAAAATAAAHLGYRVEEFGAASAGVGRADRRHRRAHRAPPVGHDPSRPAQLVPALLPAPPRPPGVRSRPDTVAARPHPGLRPVRPLAFLVPAAPPVPEGPPQRWTTSRSE